jgi:hypothetical protein
MEFREAVAKLNKLAQAMQEGEGIAAELRASLSPERLEATQAETGLPRDALIEMRHQVGTGQLRDAVRVAARLAERL